MTRSILSVLAALALLTPGSVWAQAEEAPVAPVAQPTIPDASSLADLLKQVKNGWKKEHQENRGREARFAKDKANQEAELKRAKATREREEARSTELENRFAQNEQELAALEERLQEQLGSLGELFGVVRQVAGDTRSNVHESVISAEFQDRTPFLEELGQNTALPAIEDLEKLWFILQQEMTESGKVTRFDSTIVAADGQQKPTSVVRIGPFVAVAEGSYLTWESKIQQLQELHRQPPNKFLGTLSNLDTTGGGLVRVAIDPARGTLLAAVIQSKSWLERIPDGGGIGYTIIALGSLTFLLAIARLLYILQLRSKVNSQVKSDTPNDNNPLGRIINVSTGDDSADTETLELKLDEAILRESAQIERYLWAIKVVAAIAPLMGLLGTVTGMIQTFQAITLFGTGDPKLMADGIAIALVTTMLGLCVAIPLVLMHSIIASMAKVVTDILEEQSAGLVARRAEGSE